MSLKNALNTTRTVRIVPGAFSVEISCRESWCSLLLSFATVAAAAAAADAGVAIAGGRRHGFDCAVVAVFSVHYSVGITWRRNNTIDQRCTLRSPPRLHIRSSDHAAGRPWVGECPSDSEINVSCNKCHGNNACNELLVDRFFCCSEELETRSAHKPSWQEREMLPRRTFR